MIPYPARAGSPGPAAFLALIVVWLTSGSWAAAEDPPTYVGRFGGWGSAPGQFKSPTALALDSNRHLLVVDSGNHRIQVFDAHGNYLREWGGYGTTPGRFVSPSGIAIASNGLIYVVEARDNGRVQVFAANGGFLNFWTGEDGAGAFSSASGVAVDLNGDVYVADTGNHRIQKFSPEGVFIASWGGAGSAIGQFLNPMGIACDRSGDVWIADHDNWRVQKLSPTGSPLASWEYPLVPRSPVGIALDANDNLYVTAASDSVLKLTPGGSRLTAWREQDASAILAGNYLYVAQGYRLCPPYSCWTYVNIYRLATTTPTLPTRWGTLKARYR